MLRITADIFSGRPDPVWEVDEERQARATLRALTSDRDLLTEAEPAQGNLGFRGFLIEMLSDELAQDFGLGQAVYLAVGRQASGSRTAELGERLISLIEQGKAPTRTREDALPLDVPLGAFLTTQLELTTRLESQSRVSLADEVVPAAPEQAAAPDFICNIELDTFNPDFWNNSIVRLNNNCYNYASNLRTDTFAQPGRGCGRMYTALTCNEVVRGVICDGMHRRFGCFPESEKPRYLMALTLAPGPSFMDYHCYRKLAEGFWGHKLGRKGVRNTDESNRVITNPETANRGPYTTFCGYFYGCNSQRQQIQ